MRPSRLALVGVIAAALLGAGQAAGQPSEPAGATLFDQPNFHGRAVRVVGAMSDLRRWSFGRRAMSGHFNGDWIVCEGIRFTGRCVTVIGDLPDFTPQGLDGRILSLRQADPGEPPPADAGPGAAERPSTPEADDGYFDRGGPAAMPAPEALPAEPTPPAQIEAPLDRGVAGHSSVFFVRPQRDGADVPGEGRSSADAFCREQGLGPVLYYDTDGRALRDVLCRRD